MDYYVYGLIDPTELQDGIPSLADQLAAVIYVGKGSKLRSEDHAIEARSILEQEAEKPEIKATYGRKLDRLIALFRAGTPPQSVKLSAGFAEEIDAYSVEAFAIEAINALREARGRDPLTNAIKGHGVAIEPLVQYEARLDAEEVEVADRYGAGQLAILVKADLSESGDGEYRAGDPFNLPAKVRHLSARINYMEQVRALPARRPWDLHLPWTDEEARTRARRYWPLGAANVGSWIKDPTSGPSHLLLAVKDGRNTTIRYAWHLDQNGDWEAYYGSKWGVPLGEADDHHPLLNKIPVLAGGSAAMLGNSGGCKLIRYSGLRRE